MKDSYTRELIVYEEIRVIFLFRYGDLKLDMSAKCAWIWVVFIWTAHIGTYAISWAFAGNLPFMRFALYTWLYSDNMYGFLMGKYNYYGDVTVGVLLMVINLASVLAYFKKRNQVIFVRKIIF